MRQAEHPRHQLCDELANPVRFSLVAAIAGTGESEFKLVREHLQVSDSVLSRQASALEAAGIIEIRKGFVRKRPSTWFSLTPDGRENGNCTRRLSRPSPRADDPQLPADRNPIRARHTQHH